MHNSFAGRNAASILTLMPSDHAQADALRASGSSQIDIKPRSRDVTDGLEKTAARGMLRAVGMGDDDWAKPQIGVASSWN